MSNAFQHQWGRFQENISLDKGSMPPRMLFHVIQELLRACAPALHREPFAAYRLDRFASLDPSLYPVGSTQLGEAEINHFRRIVCRYKSTEEESIARLLRDTLESLVALEIDRQCPHCGHGGLEVIKSVAEDHLVLECKQCGLATSFDGDRVNLGEWAFPTHAELREAGLLL